MLVFLSARPERQHNLFTLVHPLEPEVWIAVLASLATISLSLLCIASKEEELLRMRMPNWSSLNESSWYAFGTLIGERITRDIRSEGAWSIRWYLRESPLLYLLCT